MVPEPALADLAISGATTVVMELHSIIDVPIEMTFDVISDLSFRAEWLNGLIDSDQLNHRITQVGSTHRCVIKGDASDPVFVAHSYQFEDDHISFIESNYRDGFSTVYHLERRDAKTKLHLQVLMKPSILKNLFFRLFLKRKLMRLQKQNLANLNQYCVNLIHGGLVHPNHIELSSSEQLVPELVR